MKPSADRITRPKIMLSRDVRFDAAGVPDVVLHDLRAMSGTEAQAQGVDPQKLLGHTDRKMTERYLRDRKITEAEGPSFRQTNDNSRKPQ